MTRSGLAGLTAALCAASALAAGNEVDIANVVEEAGADPASSTLLIVRLSDGAAWISNAARAGERFPPASTSKIAHTLIAIESGYANPDSAFEWDGTVRFVDAWNRDQTLASAFAVSAVWVYQRITFDLGAPTMADWIDRFDYGNENTGTADDLTTYWLQGPLAISAREQVDFLTRLVKGGLPVSSTTLAAARPVMVADRSEAWTLYAKTGWRMNPEGTDLGWYVGWLETEGDAADTWVFALNLDMTSDEETALRRPIVRQALSRIGALPD